MNGLKDYSNRFDEAIRQMSINIAADYGDEDDQTIEEAKKGAAQPVKKVVPKATKGKKTGKRPSAVEGLVSDMASLDLNEPGNFQYEDLVKGLRANRFKKILVLTGAGISVSAGIPDFRSPGTGIYDNLADYQLPNPEKLFDIDYFKEKPEAFYKFMQSFDLTNFCATPTHYFIKMLQDKGVLWKNFT